MITFAANSNSSGITTLLFSAVAIAFLFFFMIVRPQKKNTLRHKALLDDLEIGDEIITNGGIYGTIDSINDDTIQLEIANKTNITLSKKSIAMKKVLKEELKIDDLKKDDTVKDDADLKENK